VDLGLTGRRAVVTGGSKGIGLAVAAERAPDADRGEFLDGLAAAEVPLGRFGTVDEVSGLVAFLAGSRAGYITGAVIDVAGGMGKYV
jgi:NAD(P)-dependent dehydrogenase (short-subunit alcohol dehydrogenase family)